MTNMHYLSRSFVEIGPFSTEELSTFFIRGVLKDSDYIRDEATDEWIHVQDWISALTPANKEAPAVASAPSASVTKTTAKKAATKAAKKAPAKKAAKKSA